MLEILGAMFFGFSAYTGTLLANMYEAQPFSDGPPSGEPPEDVLIVGAALLGGIVMHYGSAGAEVAIYGFVLCALTAIWCTDVRYGLVPDAFTLLPLAVVFAVSIISHSYWNIASAAIIAAPFAILALISKGHGLGWGDVKLAALGGAVVGAEPAIFVFTIACIVAAVRAYAVGKPRVPIAFAPYLAAGIAAAMPLASLAKIS